MLMCISIFSRGGPDISKTQSRGTLLLTEGKLIFYKIVNELDYLFDIQFMICSSRLSNIDIILHRQHLL